MRNALDDDDLEEEASARLDSRLDQPGQRRRDVNRHIPGQAVALRAVENGEPLQKRYGKGGVTGFLGAFALVLGHEAVRVDHRGSALALADAAAERLACRNVSQPCPGKPFSMTAPQGIRMLMPE